MLKQFACFIHLFLFYVENSVSAFWKNTILNYRSKYCTCKSAYACKRLDKYIHTCRDSFSSSVFVEQGSRWLIAIRASRSSRGEGRHCDMLSVSVLAGVSGRMWVRVSECDMSYTPYYGFVGTQTVNIMVLHSLLQLHPRALVWSVSIHLYNTH